MKPTNRTALTQRFKLFKQSSEDIRIADTTLAGGSSEPPSEPASAIDVFRDCTARGWDRDSWVTWYNWAESIAATYGASFFKSDKPMERKHMVSWDPEGKLGGIEGGLNSTEAKEILAEFHQDDFLADFPTFWEEVHACIFIPLATPAALEQDAQDFRGSYDLRTRLVTAKELIRQRLQCH